MRTQDFIAGDVIFKEGEEGTRMYILMAGTVDIQLKAGDESIRLATMKKGDFFGEMALFINKPRSATAKAVTPGKAAVIESRQQLNKFLVLNPGFAAKMVGIMAERLAHTNELLLEKANFAREIEFRLERDGKTG